jgi:hypothetical protein
MRQAVTEYGREKQEPSGGHWATARMHTELNRASPDKVTQTSILIVMQTGQK